MEMAPPDPILGLGDAFRRDSREHKINLCVGVYKDDSGKTPVFTAVRKAEERLLASEDTKSYLPIEGSPEYGAVVRGLIFGEGHEIVVSHRAATAATPGGTGALRVGADFLAKLRPGATVWISDPTWPNHLSIFRASGLKTALYPYYDAETKELSFDKMMDGLRGASKGDVVVFHACCHNPSGLDPTPEQWEALATLTNEQGLFPFFDFAYQGLGAGLQEDGAGLRIFYEKGFELFIAGSFSKNFGLYRERTGALTLVAPTRDAADAGLSHLKSVIRCNYSNPPSHGCAVVAIVLGDAGLRAQWEQELTGMRERIAAMRILFVETLAKKGVGQDFSFIARQRGMFSFSGLTHKQVIRLREEFGVYIVNSGRINVAAMTPSNMEVLCDAVVAVIDD